MEVRDTVLVDMVEGCDCVWPQANEAASTTMARDRFFTCVLDLGEMRVG